MTTKTISAYLEDERRKRGDDQLRIEEEAARIQPLQHGHHRTAKQPQLELPSPVEAAAKNEKNYRPISEKATGRAKDGDESPRDGVTSLRFFRERAVYLWLLKAILEEVDQLHNVSTRLEGLAEQHPHVSEALITIAGSVRNTATILAVLVATRSPKPI